MTLIRVAVAGIGTALAIGIVTGAGQFLVGTLQNTPVPFGTATLAGFLAALSWLPIGAGVVWVSRRYPVRTGSWRRALPIHVALAGLASAPINVIILSSWAMVGLPLPAGDFWTAVGSAALSHLPTNALMYVCISALTHLTMAPDTPHIPTPTTIVQPERTRPGHLTVRNHGRVVRVDVQAIDWIEGADDYACIHAGGRAHLCTGRLRDLEQLLDPRMFLRVHRSALINLSRVVEVNPSGTGGSIVVLHNGATVRVSRGRRAALLSALAGDDSAALISR